MPGLADCPGPATLPRFQFSLFARLPASVRPSLPSKCSVAVFAGLTDAQLERATAAVTLLSGALQQPPEFVLVLEAAAGAEDGVADATLRVSVQSLLDWPGKLTEWFEQFVMAGTPESSRAAKWTRPPATRPCKYKHTGFWSGRPKNLLIKIVLSNSTQQMSGD